jgi:hypothetical protein
MESIRTDTEGGFNTFVADQQKEPGECHLSLYQFDDKYDVVYESKPIADVPKLNLQPRGTTALLDAVGKTLNTRGEYYASLPEDERPARVVVVIITDGQENASREFSRDSIKSMITTQQDTYKWQFIFLGANIDSFSVAGGMGIRAASTMDFGTSGDEVLASYSSVSSSIKSYRSMAPEAAALVGFSDEDRLNAKKNTIQ